MICPNCASSRVFHSRAKSRRDRVLKRLLPVTFYRCHTCGWRRSKIHGGPRAIFLHLISLIGYLGSIGLVILIAAGLIMLTLSFLGISLPW